MNATPNPSAESLLEAARRWRERIPGDLHEHVVEAIYAEAGWTGS